MWERWRVRVRVGERIRVTVSVGGYRLDKCVWGVAVKIRVGIRVRARVRNRAEERRR